MDTTLYVVKIQNWDWPLHVGVKPASSLLESEPEENFLCVEALTIDGHIITPEEHRSKLVHLTLSPLPREIIFAIRDEPDVGYLHKDPADRKDLGFYARLFLPADTLHNAILCLSSKWRSVHLWVDEGAEGGAITDFGFSGDLNLEGSI